MFLPEDENGQRRAEDIRFDKYTNFYLKEFQIRFPQFTHEQVKAAIKFSEELAIERIKREDAAENDFLTSLLNRRGLYRYIDQRFQQYKREAKTDPQKMDLIRASVIVVDLDHFKQVNDRYDHDTGDEILVAFSELLKSGIRPTDIAGRWGGDEFVVYLDGESGERAVQAADRIRTESAELFQALFPHLNWDKTVSCGVYQLPSFTADSIESEQSRQILIKQSLHYADVAHFQGAKLAGRNKVGVIVPSGQIYTATLLSNSGEPPKIDYQIPAHKATGLR